MPKPIGERVPKHSLLVPYSDAKHCKANKHLQVTPSQTEHSFHDGFSRRSCGQFKYEHSLVVRKIGSPQPSHGRRSHYVPTLRCRSPSTVSGKIRLVLHEEVRLDTTHTSQATLSLFNGTEKYLHHPPPSPPFGTRLTHGELVVWNIPFEPLLAFSKYTKVCAPRGREISTTSFLQMYITLLMNNKHMVRYHRCQDGRGR